MRCLTLRQASEETGIEYRSLLAAARAGELHTFVPFGLSRKRFVRECEIERWLRSMEQKKVN